MKNETEQKHTHGSGTDAERPVLADDRSADAREGERKDPVRRRITTAKLAKMAMMVAITVVFSFIHFPILPMAPFLEYEVSDLPILVSGFVFGPASGLGVCVVSILLHDLIIGPASGPYGMIMHIIAAGVSVLVSALIYKRKKTRKGALIALIAGGVSMIAVMIPANLIFTPLFMTVPVAAVQSMLIPVILPFNALKAAINTVVVFFLYKRVSRFLHRW
ncbi:MAG: ECF transporter S component [Clostridiales Family XIII bacterium]|nr:ECF transporter S component [Clostridiales Family XIII bacterium]